MATIKQENLARAMLENIGTGGKMTKGELLIKAGYSKNMSKQPERILKAEGVKQTLEGLMRELGIDKNSRLKVLKKIFYSKDKRAVLEANKEITKMAGEYAPNQIQIQNAFQSRDEVVE